MVLGVVGLRWFFVDHGSLRWEGRQLHELYTNKNFCISIRIFLMDCGLILVWLGCSGFCDLISVSFNFFGF